MQVLFSRLLPLSTAPKKQRERERERERARERERESELRELYIGISVHLIFLTVT